MVLTIVKIVEAIAENSMLKNKRFLTAVSDCRKLNRDVTDLAVSMLDFSNALKKLTVTMATYGKMSLMQEEVSRSHKEALDVHDKVISVIAEATGILDVGKDQLFDMTISSSKLTNNKPN